MASEGPERWLELAQQFPIGPKRGGMLRSGEMSEDVAPGQIRQAYWHDASTVVVIVGIDDVNAQADVVPATLEAGIEDEAAVVIEDQASPVHGPISIWPHARSSIPFAVLGSAIASMPRSLLQLVDQATHHHTLIGVRPGRAHPPHGSGGALAIDDMFDALDILADGPRLQRGAAAKPLTQLQIPLQDIMTALHVPQPRAMAIRTGKEPLTFEEASALAQISDLAVADVLAAVAPLPDDLVRELHEPRWRSHIHHRAIDGDEESARSQLGYQAYQLAARETGQGRQRWRQRLSAVVAADQA
ncbi:hypothetical protein [Mycobacteroides franklinii]|uniref:Uncharacterized protein n=1 Tax=Mycobacteroides franklinii TaxID=948102 RepID=A0A4R8QXU4_9MYCO|nr:hypothetical protein [Mycobacteroides franklinii]TDZ45194.1 hypothetical protein CCUG64054_00837 [Mycobacteroides franklinii]TDZ48685.1 hypothetical protein CCUG63697_03214 [Mycobacteroides franklinii]TDZ58866.1 hypothetical protein CCUG63696_00841 [Mycobacteroides franklinii]TDZ66380.1 hypothetical protein CCUG63695_00203 [Mycobacteroides franklinii]TDZ72303.1 hypothetical protein CCUG64056_00837 [Mycobacteroides franklinii]